MDVKADECAWEPTAHPSQGKAAWISAVVHDAIEILAPLELIARLQNNFPTEPVIKLAGIQIIYAGQQMIKFSK